MKNEEKMLQLKSLNTSNIFLQIKYFVEKKILFGNLRYILRLIG